MNDCFVLDLYIKWCEIIRVMKETKIVGINMIQFKLYIGINPESKYRINANCMISLDVFFKTIVKFKPLKMNNTEVISVKYSTHPFEL